MKSAISSAVLADFLVEAHLNTYADKSAARSVSSRLWSFDYRFERDDLAYHDSYLGTRDFIGEEVIYQRELPIWGMNYHGVILAPDGGEREVYAFLRTALRQQCAGILPVRGPRRYRQGSLAYDNAVDGALDEFSGIELIERDGQPLYRCRYHGGRVS
jgi:hypothetical protein